ncbi:2-amino-4-hydroxy-6-hydroxymethyldihydropteridine diphosphokinase [Flaviflexus huanghaiensis]|uniref:2-amino-4-hydroxy-6- hydroxymethyldihydropteridine diphosphokinase n=1 Tax=Flaviflexus huanghaiensis TaxID=1111473 RepID=UPI0015FD90E1|nr:2-amino-4-hydroxy-6-hydroxymethyldihydropteridine diphosphokinase [Flaviflexus huanghaiensis]
MTDLYLPTGALADRIELTGLTARGYHGVHDFEKAEGQDFIVDIVLHTTVSRAAASDNLAHTISYSDVAGDAMTLITGEPFDLIETLAERIAESALATGALAVDVTVHKPSAPITHTFSDVSVSVRRLGVLLATPKPAADVVVGIGSNLDNPVTQVDIGAGKLARILEYEQMSRTRVTAADVAPGQPTQPNYVNAVMIGKTRLSPLGLLAELQRIEDEQGRTREDHWGPRTLDLDLISYKIAGHEITSDNPDLTLPHPRAHMRTFVMEPWAEVDPWGHLRGKPIR